MPPFTPYAILGVAVLCAACAPTTPPLARQSPLTIDVQWNRPGHVPPPFDDAAAVARDIVVGWDPRVYSASEIDAIADRQCGAFDRDARAIDRPTGTSARRVQRFDCVAPSTAGVRTDEPADAAARS